MKRAQVNHEDRRRRIDDIFNIIRLSRVKRRRVLTEAVNVSQTATKFAALWLNDLKETHPTVWEDMQKQGGKKAEISFLRPYEAVRRSST